MADCGQYFTRGVVNKERFKYWPVSGDLYELQAQPRPKVTIKCPMKICVTMKTPAKFCPDNGYTIHGCILAGRGFAWVA